MLQSPCRSTNEWQLGVPKRPLTLPYPQPQTRVSARVRLTHIQASHGANERILERDDVLGRKGRGPSAGRVHAAAAATAAQRTNRAEFEQGVVGEIRDVDRRR